MDSFVDLIKKIGIFMIAAQAVIHFAPGQKYEKYIKMVVSIMVLLQFLEPVYEIFAKTQTDWEAEFHALEDELSGGMEEQTNAYMGTDQVTRALVSSIEQEIKSKLNSVAGDENYIVENVRVTIHVAETEEDAVNKQYALDQVRVVVRRQAEFSLKEDREEDGEGEELSKIEIPKIILAESRGDGQSVDGAYDGEGEREGRTEGERAAEEKLRERFCGVLGMEEKYMEVSLYGFVEDGFQ